MDPSDWQGRLGDVWAREWVRTDRSFVGVARALDAAILGAAPDTGTVLDLGCGAGSTSLALAAARPSLAITGIDLSADLIAVARSRGAGQPNLRFEVADIADPSAMPGGGYAMAVSRHGVMFFADPVAAFAAIRSRLEPGAPLIFSCFRSPECNPWATEPLEAIAGAPPRPADTAPGPFAFADPDHVASILHEAGWCEVAKRAVDCRYLAGAGPDPVADAVEFLSRIGPAARALADVPPDDRAAALTRVRAVLERRIVHGAVDFPAAAWIWSARA